MRPSSARLKTYVREYFLSREAEEIPVPSPLSAEIDLVFLDGRNRVAVKLLDLQGVPAPQARKMVSESLLSMLRVAGDRVEKLYLAVMDGGYSKLPPESEFRVSGIGLLLVSPDGTVEEKIPARPLPSGHNREIAKDIERLSRELQRLSAEIEEIRGEIEKLRSLSNRLAALESEVRNLSAKIKSLKVGEKTAAPPTVALGEVKAEVEVSEGPDFLKGNPWLTVLSKRGAEH